MKRIVDVYTPCTCDPPPRRWFMCTCDSYLLERYECHQDFDGLEGVVHPDDAAAEVQQSR